MKTIDISQIEMRGDDSLILNVEGSAEKALAVWIWRGVLYFNGPINKESRTYKLTREGIVQVARCPMCEGMGKLQGPTDDGGNLVDCTYCKGAKFIG
jgi:hypothetical protein